MCFPCGAAFCGKSAIACSQTSVVVFVEFLMFALAAASGIAVAQRLKVNVGGVVEVTPQGGKVARMMAAPPEFQAHDWYRYTI